MEFNQKTILLLVSRLCGRIHLVNFARILFHHLPITCQIIKPSMIEVRTHLLTREAYSAHGYET